MDEDGEDLTPFWVQSSTNRGRVRHFRHGVSSLFLSSGLLVSIYWQNNVKKSWDSLNLVLVLFALVFGFLSKKKNEDRNFEEYQITPRSSTRTETQQSNPSTPRAWYNYSSSEAEKSNQSKLLRWYGYSDQMAYNTGSNNSRGRLLKRTSSSYPGLLVASSRLISRDDPWRYYDDMSIETCRYSDSGELHRRQSWKYTFDDSQNLYVDKFVQPHPKEQSPSNPPAPAPLSPPQATAPPASPSSPPVSPPLPPTSPSLDNEKPNQTKQSIAHKRERRRKTGKSEKIRTGGNATN